MRVASIIAWPIRLFGSTGADDVSSPARETQGTQLERLFATLPVLSHVEIAKGVEVRVLGSIS